MVRFGSRNFTADPIKSGEIEDGAIVNADINAAAAIAYSKLATDPRICRIKTGKYTGDGSTSQAITGVGFAPKVVLIDRYEEVAGAASGSVGYYRTDVMYGDLCNCFRGDANPYSNLLISLGSDGFTVDDAGVDSDPNKNGEGYQYMAFG